MDQKEEAMESTIEEIRPVSQQDKPQQKASVQEDQLTLRPPILSKDGTAVTGAQKHHLKNQKSDGKLINIWARNNDHTGRLAMTQAEQIMKSPSQQLTTEARYAQQD